MRIKLLTPLLAIFLTASTLTAETFDEYLTGFDYEERQAMKIKSAEAMKLYASGEAVFIDIRFHEENALWNFPFMKSIPLNELPARLGEIDKSKTIITVCPHYDRAEIARLYLTMKGYKSRYLTDGLLGLAGYLRGDVAKETYEELEKK
ncbi:rhodanese-like domain-containing protein [Sulfuricurvum sp.]|uniref:rhodanese-like domain-containing protein n=1 Tax=Sulfuricurvum sp. TaxID=2025608 RepID=UPI0026249443|nr:rhodanese-like domain-containing protein [Sulfuricurvum sp.]MDD2781533.1 rhodanese-like domain-containing protein [Sulfuricurvum sp.]